MKIITKALDDKDKRIIQLAIRKVSYYKMTRIVQLSRNGIYRRIKEMKDYYDQPTLPKLVEYLTDNNLL